MPRANNDITFEYTRALDTAGYPDEMYLRDPIRLTADPNNLSAGIGMANLASSYYRTDYSAVVVPNNQIEFTVDADIGWFMRITNTGKLQFNYEKYPDLKIDEASKMFLKCLRKSLIGDKQLEFDF